jgi:hypothetical protein
MSGKRKKGPHKIVPTKPSRSNIFIPTTMTAVVMPPMTTGGCFRFDVGGAQYWNIDQLYGWLKGPNYNPTTNPGDLIWKKITPVTQYLPGNGFSIVNYQNQDLSAYVQQPFLILDPNVVKCSFIFESPDLSYNTTWQNAKGYSLNILRTFISHLLWANNNPNLTIYSAQLELQIYRIDKTTGQNKIDPSTNLPFFTYAQYDDAKQQFIDTPIDYNTKKSLTFKPSILTNPPISEETRIFKLRIRCTMWGYLGPGELENAYGGYWILSDICPEF